MKKALIIAALLVFGTFSMATAQDLVGMFNLSPFGGLGMPMGDMADEEQANRKMGFKFGVAGEYFFTNNIAAGINFMYAIFGNDFEDADDKLHTMNIGAHGKYVFVPEGMLRPYVMAGAGITMNKFKDFMDPFGDDTGEYKLDSKIFLMGGVGAMYWVSEMISVFGELGLDYLMTDGAGVEFEGETIEDAEVDINLMFIDFKVGINIWFGGQE